MSYANDPVSGPKLGLRANLTQFILLVVVNAFVGAMVGMERTILPAIAEQEFLLAARTAILSFIVVFGISKALTNYLAGHLADVFGRKGLIAGGMWLQAFGIGVIALSSKFPGFASGAILLGAGTAMVYPTLLAAIGDSVNPSWRASTVGVYRLWRDLGYGGWCGACRCRR